MGGRISMAALVLVLAANLLQSTYGATYTVGDSTGWVIPTGNTNLYDTWADNKNFSVGDVLVFRFTTGQHNVAEVTEAAYDACTVANPMYTRSSGPASVTLNRTGDHYFICAFTSHCSRGQKLNVEVGNGNGTATTPTTPATPTSGGTPGANSASSVVATLSPFFFMSVALVLLC